MVMDDDKLADVITNLELACHHMKRLEGKTCLDSEEMKIYSYSIQLMKESLQILRGFEVRNEIEHFSVSEDE